MKKYYIPLLIASIICGFFACDNVDEGYKIDYPDSSSEFAVALQTPDRGSINDTIKYTITANSNTDIKSIVVKSSISGGDGTGLIVPDGVTDPLVDHIFGTIQPGTQSLDLQYQYIINQDTLDPTITFTLIDEEGENCDTSDLMVIPDIAKYFAINLYAQTNSLADGFSTADNIVYHNLTNYANVSTVNAAIQKSLDIVFIKDGDNAMLVAPYSGYFSSGMSTKNKTLFKKIEEMNSCDFDNLSNADVSEITEENMVKKGTTDIDNLQVGDIIGFRTDFASANPYHFGLIRINAIHPTNVEYYDGISYIIEIDVISQI